MWVTLMKKIFICFLFTILSSSIFAFNFGGTINNDFYAVGNSIKNFTAEESPSISFWFSTPLDFQGNTKINFDISYDFSVLIPDSLTSHLIDINLLNITMKIPLSTSWYCDFVMGRRYFKDITSFIYDDKIDCLAFDFAFSKAKMNFLAGYTGLLNIYSHNTYELSNPTIENKLYSFSDSAALLLDAQVKLDLAFPIKSIEYLSLTNLGNIAKNKVYLSLNAKNSLTDSLNYDITSSFLIRGNKKIANYTNAEIITSKGKNDISANLIFYSSENNILSSFEPYTINNKTESKLFSPGRVILGGGFTHNIKKNTFFNGNAKMLFKLPTAENKISYDGLFINLLFNIQAVSDFFINFGYEQFLSANNNNFSFFFCFELKY